MVSLMDRTIKDTMRSHLDTFFTSLQNDGPALKSFLTSISTFSGTIQLHRHKLKEDTLSLVQNFATIIHTVASNVIDLENTRRGIDKQFQHDVSTILEPKMQALEISDQTSTLSKNSMPAYIQPSYKWLLANLHNPYPSKNVKKDISKETGCSIKDIDAWFIDARKRIGWNALRKNKFSNKQEKIISAATHFFQPKATSFSDDPNATMISQMDPNDIYRPDFLAILIKTKSLYADRFPELNHFEHLDMPSEVYQRRLLQKSLLPQDTATSYPTPLLSPCDLAGYSRHSTPATTSVQSESNVRKRSRTLSEVSESEDEMSPTHLSKRVRAMTEEVVDSTFIYGLPSPAPTIEILDNLHSAGSPASPAATELVVSSNTSGLKRKRSFIDTEDGNLSDCHLASSPTETIQSAFTSTQPTSKRKRRLSDSETEQTRKRPHNALCVPRLQTVSDPFPAPTPSLDELAPSWRQDESLPLLDLSVIPEPVSSEIFPVASALEVSYGQYATTDTYTNMCSEDLFAYLDSSIDGILPSVSSDSRSDLHYLSDCPQKPGFDNYTAVPTKSSAVASSLDHDLSLLTSFSSIDPRQFMVSSEWPTFQSDYTSTDSSSLYTCETTSLNHVLSFSLPDHNSSAAVKRARIKALNEQIRQLEAEL